MKVAVLGASPKAERYSNKAVRKLTEHGFDVVPVNPAHETIVGLDTAASLEDVEPGSVDTVTVYVNPARSSQLADALLGVEPRRVIFNPGAENPELAETLAGVGIEVEEACTLVLLGTGQF